MENQNLHCLNFVNEEPWDRQVNPILPQDLDLDGISTNHHHPNHRRYLSLLNLEPLQQEHFYL